MARFDGGKFNTPPKIVEVKKPWTCPNRGLVVTHKFIGEVNEFCSGDGTSVRISGFILQPDPQYQEEGHHPVKVRKVDADIVMQDMLMIEASCGFHIH